MSDLLKEILGGVAFFASLIIGMISLMFFGI